MTVVMMLVGPAPRREPSDLDGLPQDPVESTPV
jgi:hypothetical protein